MYAFCTSGWNAMTLSKSEIMPVKTAYSATHGVDRRPPAPLGPKQTNIQLPCLSVTMCSTESIKLPVGRWHLSVRLCQDWCATVRPAATHTPRTQSHHFYDILRNLFFFFNTAHCCRHTNLPQRDPIYGLINFYTADPSPFPLILSFQNSYYIGFSYGEVP